MLVKIMGVGLALALMMVPLQRCGGRGRVVPPPDIPPPSEVVPPPTVTPPVAPPPGGQPTPAGCSYQDSGSAAVSTFVIGGRNSVQGCRPYHVGMFYGNGGYLCGGTLIGDEWVLTAAHCIDGRSGSSNITVRVGGYQLSANDGTNIRVSQQYSHPSYNNRRPDRGADIALLRLSQPAPANLVRAIVPSPSTESQIAFDGARLTLTGWGQIDSRQRRPADILKETELTASSYRNCSRSSGDICGGARNTSGCYGDSGGPLVGRLGGQFYSIGAVSRGTRDCDGQTTFTRTAGYADWIQQTTGIVPR